MAGISNKHGSVLLILLVAIVIGAMLYMLDIRAIFGPSLQTVPMGVEERPWLLEDLLAAEGETIGLPKSPKPTLETPIVLAGPVDREGQPRGTVQIILNTEGRVTAVWTTEYAHQQRTFELEATAAGNIDVKQTYQDANGRDKSRLFFIAQGPYTLVTHDPQIGRSEERGTVWLLGYLRPDGHADGTLTLTTDREWAAVYNYTAERE